MRLALELDVIIPWCVSLRTEIHDFGMLLQLSAQPRSRFHNPRKKAKRTVYEAFVHLRERKVRERWMRMKIQTEEAQLYTT